MITLQQVLDESKEQKNKLHRKFPVLMQFYDECGFDEANATISQHWHNVDRGLTPEYEELKK